MGAVLMLLASASFATMAAMVKAIGPGIPMTQLVFLRCLLALPVLFLFIRQLSLPALVKARGVLVIRTLLGMTAMHAFFYALTHMPLADCIFIGRVQPLLLALFAPLVLGESAPRSAWFAIATGLAGVGLVMTPGVNWSLAGAVAFGGAALSAGAHMLVRRLNRTDQPLIIVFNFIFLTGAISGVWSIPNFVPLTGRQWLLISGVAFFASLGQMLMTLAYRRDQAPAVAAASYSSVILSVFYGAFFWNEVPGIPALAGAALILTGGLFLVKSRFRVSEPASPP